ncbi:MAG: glycosyltransferase family 4 protein [Acidobacteriota bacterium]|nr:glycosyltransferase family 4 protein [Acidobacteriota bacterium]
MRILQISSAKNFGGGERHLVDLCKGLTGGGHDVFAALRVENDWREKLSFLPEKNFINLGLRNSFDLFSARKLAKFIRDNNIEIVHAHLARDYPAASLAVRFVPVAKLVLTRHVLFPVNFLQRFVLNNVSKVIAVSNAVETNLRKTFPAEKIAVIYNGIETEKRTEANQQNFRNSFRQSHDIPFDAVLIGIVGELKPLKGQEDFVLAAQIIARKFPDARFVVVGKDNARNQNFRQKLKRLVKIFNLESHFLWLDWVEETVELLGALDVFVSASHSESFGLAIVEAMASSCAVVATDTNGAKEIIDDNKTGKLVSIGNPVELAEAVGALLADEKLRRALGENARKAVLERFGVERMVVETERVYREITRREKL